MENITGSRLNLSLETQPVLSTYILTGIMKSMKGLVSFVVVEGSSLSAVWRYQSPSISSLSLEEAF